MFFLVLPKKGENVYHIACYARCDIRCNNLFR